MSQSWGWRVPPRGVRSQQDPTGPLLLSLGTLPQLTPARALLGPASPTSPASLAFSFPPLSLTVGFSLLVVLTLYSCPFSPPPHPHPHSHCADPVAFYQAPTEEVWEAMHPARSALADVRSRGWGSPLVSLPPGLCHQDHTHEKFS